MATQTELAKQLRGTDLTLDEKLEAIDRMLEEAVATSVTAYNIPTDPADLTICLGCQ